VGRGGDALDKLNARLKNDRTVVTEAVHKCGLALKFASESLRGCQSVVDTAVSQNGMALVYASDALRGNREVVLRAVQRDGEALAFASKDCRSDWEIVHAVARYNPADAMWYMEKALKDEYGLQGEVDEYNSAEWVHRMELRNERRPSTQLPVLPREKTGVRANRRRNPPRTCAQHAPMYTC